MIITKGCIFVNSLLSIDIEHLTFDGTTLYGVTKDIGIYRLENSVWQMVVSDWTMFHGILYEKFEVFHEDKNFSYNKSIHIRMDFQVHQILH